MKELFLETIVPIALGTLLVLVVWLVFSMMVHSWISRYSWYEKIKYTYKFKIPEKFQTKVSPIYELCENDWDSGMNIRKWSLQYYQKEGHMILSLFLLYPIEFLTYGYQIDDTVFLCKKKDIESVEGTLEENYEKIWAKENEEYLTKRALKDNQKQKIKDLNQVFDENYE